MPGAMFFDACYNDAGMQPGGGPVVIRVRKIPGCVNPVHFKEPRGTVENPATLSQAL